MRFNNISEGRSLRNDVGDIIPTLRGNALHPFFRPPHTKVMMAVQLRSIPLGLPFYLQNSYSSPSSVIAPGCSTRKTSPWMLMMILNPIIPR